MNNEGPSNDVEEMKFCSIMQIDVRGWGTIRPVEEKETWGDIAFRSTDEGGDGYGDYLSINLFINDGLDKIVAYNK